MFRPLLILAFIGASIAASAKGTDSLETDSLISSITIEQMLVLPELDTLISAALEFSPALKGRQAQVGRNEAEVKIRKREWTNRVFTDAGGAYANNYNVLTVANGDAGGFQSVALGNGNSMRVGVTARISLFDIIGRNQLIARAEAEKQMSEYDLQVAQQDLKALVTQMYTQLKLGKTLVEVNTNTYYTLSAQLEMAEKEFRQGEIHITELARVTEIKSKSEVALEQAKANYENLYYQLELLVGRELLTFI